MSEYFKGKVVLITGASSGIGKALAEEFFARGALLVLAARRQDRLEKICQDFNRAELRALPLVCDVATEEDQNRAVQKALDTFGKLDIVIANAGYGVVGSFERLKLEDYRRQFETNVFGVLKTAYASFEALKKTQGHLVLIGSVNSYVSFRGVSAYAMSKFSIRALAEALWHEWRDHKIKVNLICPGYVESEIRQIDNQGNWHPEPAAPAPELLRMKAPQAAKIILRAVRKNKREQIITFHAGLGIYLSRYCPNLLHFLFRVLKVRGRRSP